MVSVCLSVLLSCSLALSLSVFLCLSVCLSFSLCVCVSLSLRLCLSLAVYRFTLLYYMKSFGVGNKEKKKKPQCWFDKKIQACFSKNKNSTRNRTVHIPFDELFILFCPGEYCVISRTITPLFTHRHIQRHKHRGGRGGFDATIKKINGERKKERKG